MSSRKLTYGDFTRTGWQDCGNVFDVDTHHEAWVRLGKPHGLAAAARVVREAWGDDDEAREAWLEQADVDEIVEDGLEPRRAYAAWRDAWQDCATSAVKERIREWIASEEGAWP
jgi:hypothetical protein